MRYTCLRITLLFLVSWSACAQSSPDDVMFKGFPLGGHIDDFKQKFPDFDCAGKNCFFDCKINCAPSFRGAPYNPSTYNAMDCIKRNTYGDVILNKAVAQFEDTGLRRVTVEFSPSSFDRLEKALRERYGPPSTENRETMQNRMGATFENQRSTWIKASGVLWNTKYASSLDRGAVHILSQEEWDRTKQREEQRRQSAPKDL